MTEDPAAMPFLRTSAVDGGTFRLRCASPADLPAIVGLLADDKTRLAAHRFYERLGFEASHEGMKPMLRPLTVR